MLRKLLLVILSIVFFSGSTVFAVTPLEDDLDIMGGDKGEPVNSMGLTAEAAEVANDLNIMPLVAELQTLKQQTKDNPNNVQLLSLRTQLVERLFMSTMEMQMVMAEIDSEVTRTNEIKAYLESRRDKAIRLNNIANFVTGGGLGVLGNALQYMPNEFSGETTELVAGVVTMGLAGAAIKQQNGEKQSLDRAPNMLAQLFDRESASSHTRYPPAVWKYLNAVPPTHGKATLTRRQLLFRKWERFERIEHRGNPASERKIELLAGTVPQRRAVTIDLLDDRSAMLTDLRAEISSMSHGLLELMRACSSS
jgi:hypothetical protein